MQKRVIFYEFALICLAVGSFVFAEPDASQGINGASSFGGGGTSFRGSVGNNNSISADFARDLNSRSNSLVGGGASFSSRSNFGNSSVGGINSNAGGAYDGGQVGAGGINGGASSVNSFRSPSNSFRTQPSGFGNQINNSFRR